MGDFSQNYKDFTPCEVVGIDSLIEFNRNTSPRFLLITHDVNMMTTRPPYGDHFHIRMLTIMLKRMAHIKIADRG